MNLPFITLWNFIFQQMPIPPMQVCHHHQGEFWPPRGNSQYEKAGLQRVQQEVFKQVFSQLSYETLDNKNVFDIKLKSQTLT